jgi:hypothetical protein
MRLFKYSRNKMYRGHTLKNIRCMRIFKFGTNVMLTGGFQNPECQKGPMISSASERYLYPPTAQPKSRIDPSSKTIQH